MVALLNDKRGEKKNEQIKKDEIEKIKIKKRTRFALLLVDFALINKFEKQISS